MATPVVSTTTSSAGRPASTVDPGAPAGIEHPSFSAPVRYQVEEVPDDPDLQVERTIQLMRRYALEDAADPGVQELAAQLKGSTEKETAARVFAEVKRRIRFLHDEAQAAPLKLDRPGSPVVEVLVRPVDMLTAGTHGDCDDYAMLAAALLYSLGIRTSFVTVAADPRSPSSYSHVYLAVYTSEGERIALDASHGSHLGWEAPNRFGKRAEWPLTPHPLGGMVAGVVALALIAYLFTGGEADL